MREKFAALAALLVLGAASAAGAQKTESMGVGDGGSPHQRTTWTVNGATISIEYGRPYLKGRQESLLMPVGQAWRTGADQATVITSDKPLTFGDVKLAPGSYTINMQPGERSWQMILGKLGSKGQWGIPYLPSLEIGRAPMQLSHAKSPVEEMTINVESGATPTLRLEWGNVIASAPFRVGG